MNGRLTSTLQQELAAQLKQMNAVSRDAMLALLKPWLERQRAQLRDAFETGGSVESLLSDTTSTVDALIRAILAHSDAPAELCAIATGGYGRGELFPYSDIDLLFLVEPKHLEAATPAIETLLYLLWDLNLTVGHATRSLQQTLDAARGDTTILTALLDARYIAGSTKLFSGFEAVFQRDVVGHDMPGFIEAKLSERDARHQRLGDSRYLLEPNVKESKGALRDLHTLYWLARYCYGVKSIGELVDRGLITFEEYDAFAQAEQTLWEFRAHLHFLCGKPEERLTFDRQLQIAPKLGFDDEDPNKAVERMMKHYFTTVGHVGSLTRIICALLEEEKKRKPRHMLGWKLYHSLNLEGFELDGERITVKDESEFVETPSRMMLLFSVAQKHGLDIHPTAMRYIIRHLNLIETLERDEEASRIFMDILLSKHAPYMTLRKMNEIGVLGRFLPDFGRIVGQTQFDMYHIYTVDEHTLVALGNLHKLEIGKYKTDMPFASELIKRVGSRSVLMLAMLCHDIAKGRGGDHAEIGELLSYQLTLRLTGNEHEAESVAFLVRNHLVFSHTAFKRDINDPQTIRDLVDIVQSPERLRLLYLLTVADIRAVGPGVWNAWKDSLLKDLYLRAEELIGTGAATLGQRQTANLVHELGSFLPGWSRDAVQAYIDLAEPNFLAHCPPEMHAHIATLLREAENRGIPLVIESMHRPKDAISDIIICTPDQPGLFARLSGALALSSANIVSAKIFTLKNGMAVDIFQVQDVTGGSFDKPDKLARMTVKIEQAVMHELDIEEALTLAKPAYPSRFSSIRVIPQVFIENDASAIYTVIEVVGRDRPGFLYAVTATLAREGLSVASAHISTYGAQAVDVFYVKDTFGLKVTHEKRLRAIRESLMRAVED